MGICMLLDLFWNTGCWHSASTSWSKQPGVTRKYAWKIPGSEYFHSWRTKKSCSPDFLISLLSSLYHLARIPARASRSALRGHHWTRHCLSHLHPHWAHSCQILSLKVSLHLSNELNKEASKQHIHSQLSLCPAGHLGRSAADFNLDLLMIYFNAHRAELHANSRSCAKQTPVSTDSGQKKGWNQNWTQLGKVDIA